MNFQDLLHKAPSTTTVEVLNDQELITMHQLCKSDIGGSNLLEKRKSQWLPIVEGEIVKRKDEIEKGKKAEYGEIREWNGKKMKKQPNGKWVEVSTFGKTKKEHEETSKQTLPQDMKKEGWDQKGFSKLHKEESSKLSDKEYEDHEVGGEREEIVKEYIENGIFEDYIKDLDKKVGDSTAKQELNTWLLEGDSDKETLKAFIEFHTDNLPSNITNKVSSRIRAEKAAYYSILNNKQKKYGFKVTMNPYSSE